MFALRRYFINPGAYYSSAIVLTTLFLPFGMMQLLENVMHVRRACVYSWGTKYSSLGNYFMYADIDTSEIPANRVRSCGLITSAETSLKKVRKASQFMIYHLRMNSVTGLIDSKEKIVF